MRVHAFNVPGQYPVTLKVLAGSFTVEYGEQVKQHLDYASAAMELGACLMHALACNGLMDDNRELNRLPPR